MLRYALFAVICTVSAAGAAKAVLAMDARDGRALSAQVATPTAQAAGVTAAEGAPAQIAKAADGHYWAEADVDGRRVRFVVDTGATVVALTPEDAKRLGYDPAKLDFIYGVQTANGQARAARVELASVSVAGARVKNVDAFVMEDGLETSLLGMSYLGRLSRFEASPTGLILRP